MKRLLEFGVLLGLLMATTTQAQVPGRCASVGGGGSTAANPIEQGTMSPVGATRQMGPAELYLPASPLSPGYLGFAAWPLGGLVWTGGVSQNGTIAGFALRSRMEGIFLDDAALPTDCDHTSILLSGSISSTPPACPKRFKVPDACGDYTGEYPTRTYGLGSGSIYAPLLYHQSTFGSLIAPAIDAGLMTILQPSTDVNGGFPVAGVFHAGAYDSHIPNLSIYPWSGVLRPGTEVVIDDLTHGIMVGNVGSYVAKFRADYASGGFQGDPNYHAFSPSFRGNLQSYISLAGMGYQITLGDMGSPVYSFDPTCPQVIGHLVALDSPDNIAFAELDSGAVFPGLIAASGGTINKLSEAGNLTCSKDNPPPNPRRTADYIPLGENWLPNITTSAYLAGRYQNMDRFLTSNCDHPNGGTCGSQTWADVIMGVDSNIQAVGAKDNSDAAGNSGDVYWSVHFFCTITELINGKLACSSDGNNALLWNILHTVMPGTSTTVLQGMQNFGVAIPPLLQDLLGHPYYQTYIPNIDGVTSHVLQLIVSSRGRNTSDNLEAQQGNTIIIGGVMFNAQPNPPGQPGAPPAVTPTPDGGSASEGAGYTDSSSSVPANGGDAPNGAPVY